MPWANTTSYGVKRGEWGGGGLYPRGRITGLKEKNNFCHPVTLEGFPYKSKNPKHAKGARAISAPALRKSQEKII